MMNPLADLIQFTNKLWAEPFSFDTFLGGNRSLEFSCGSFPNKSIPRQELYRFCFSKVIGVVSWIEMEMLSAVASHFEMVSRLGLWVYQKLIMIQIIPRVWTVIIASQCVLWFTSRPVLQNTIFPHFFRLIHSIAHAAYVNFYVFFHIMLRMQYQLAVMSSHWREMVIHSVKGALVYRQVDAGLRYVIEWFQNEAGWKTVIGRALLFPFLSSSASRRLMQNSYFHHILSGNTVCSYASRELKDDALIGPFVSSLTQAMQSLHALFSGHIDCPPIEADPKKIGKAMHLWIEWLARPQLNLNMLDAYHRDIVFSCLTAPLSVGQRNLLREHLREEYFNLSDQKLLHAVFSFSVVYGIAEDLEETVVIGCKKGHTHGQHWLRYFHPLFSNDQCWKLFGQTPASLRDPDVKQVFIDRIEYSADFLSVIPPEDYPQLICIPHVRQHILKHLQLLHLEDRVVEGIMRRYILENVLKDVPHQNREWPFSLEHSALILLAREDLTTHILSGLDPIDLSAFQTRIASILTFEVAMDALIEYIAAAVNLTELIGCLDVLQENAQWERRPEWMESFRSFVETVREDGVSDSLERVEVQLLQEEPYSIFSVELDSMLGHQLIRYGRKRHELNNPPLSSPLSYYLENGKLPLHMTGEEIGTLLNELCQYSFSPSFVLKTWFEIAKHHMDREENVPLFEVSILSNVLSYLSPHYAYLPLRHWETALTIHNTFRIHKELLQHQINPLISPDHVDDWEVMCAASFDPDNPRFVENHITWLQEVFDFIGQDNILTPGEDSQLVRTFIQTSIQDDEVLGRLIDFESESFPPR